MRNIYPTLKILILVLTCIQFTVACATSQPSDQAKPDSGPFPQEQVSSYIRKAFNVPSTVSITVTKQEESKFPGLVAIKVQFTSERGPQTQDAWVTPDYKTLLIGRVLDMSVDPYKATLAKMNLKNSPTHGSPDAKVTIVEFTDFQCPYCKNAHASVNQLLKEYDGKVRVVYKSLPLAMHNWAQDSAVAATCVNEQSTDAFWKYADYFFQNQATITKETLNAKVFELAKANNVDEAKLKACIDTKKTLPAVEADLQEAKALGLSSTPSFIVNGRTVVGAIPVDQFKQIIDEALASTN